MKNSITLHFEKENIQKQLYKLQRNPVENKKCAKFYNLGYFG